MPFPPLSLQQKIPSPARDLFSKKKTVVEKRDSGKEKQTSTWTTVNLRNLGRRSQGEKCKIPSQKDTQGKASWMPTSRAQDPVPALVRRSSSVDNGRPFPSKEEVKKKEIQFTLSLTPEAIVVIQKRNLEKQMLAKQQKCCASTDFRHRRVFPSKKTLQGGSKGVPVVKVEEAEQDITAIVKISLLNDQHKYDDVEYEEEEDGDVDETVMRKCKEWLKGVESAAALGKVDKLSSLPHLKGCCS
ncbi:proline-rich protein 18 [Stigmatopora nigra]